MAVTTSARGKYAVYCDAVCEVVRNARSRCEHSYWRRSGKQSRDLMRSRTVASAGCQARSLSRLT